MMHGSLKGENSYLWHSFRQNIFIGGHSCRSVIILESNSGYLQLLELLQARGHRGKVRAEDAQRVLKDLVFDLWRSDNCEERSDTLKMLALVDFYLPFLPLERPHIERLFGMKLLERRKGLMDAKQAANLTWDEDVVHFLTDRVRHKVSLNGCM